MLVSCWDKYLKRLPVQEQDIYFTEKYVSLCAEETGDVPECFVYQEQGSLFFFLYLKRKVTWLQGEWYDFETPYGYGGPLTNCLDKEFILRASKVMFFEMKAAGLIAGFIRFHPLLANQQLLENTDGFQIVRDRQTVLMDLTLSEDELWRKSLHPKHRNSVREAEKAGAVFEVDENLTSLSEFVSLYHETMTRVEAGEFYFFSDRYFENLKKFKENVFLGLVRYEKRIAAAAIFFCWQDKGHYHLSASRESLQHLRPNNMLIYKTALFMKSKGLKSLHLGGGTTPGEDDGLYKFKARFSPGRTDFYIGRAVLNQDRYDKACRSWAMRYPDKDKDFSRMVLKYRF